MELAQRLLLVVSMLALAAAVLVCIYQLFREGLKGVKTMPAALFMGIYVVTFGLWLAL